MKRILLTLAVLFTISTSQSQAQIPRREPPRPSWQRPGSNQANIAQTASIGARINGIGAGNGTLVVGYGVDNRMVINGATSISVNGVPTNMAGLLTWLKQSRQAGARTFFATGLMYTNGTRIMASIDFTAR